MGKHPLVVGSVDPADRIAVVGLASNVTDERTPSGVAISPLDKWDWREAVECVPLQTFAPAPPDEAANDTVGLKAVGASALVACQLSRSANHTGWSAFGQSAYWMELEEIELCHQTSSSRVWSANRLYSVPASRRMASFWSLGWMSTYKLIAFINALVAKCSVSPSS